MKDSLKILMCQMILAANKQSLTVTNNGRCSQPECAPKKAEICAFVSVMVSELAIDKIKTVMGQWAFWGA